MVNNKPKSVWGGKGLFILQLVDYYGEKMLPPGPSNQEQDKVDTIHIFVLQLDINEYASIVLSSHLNQSSVILTQRISTM